MHLQPATHLEKTSLSPRESHRVQPSLPTIPEALAPGRPGGERLLTRNGVEYFELAARSVLTWVNGTHMKQVYSINPYRGCELGCSYCYARYTHEFMDLPDWETFERKIFVKTQAARVLKRELASSKKVLEHGITIGTATDPYQPAEAQFGITRKILETLLPHRGLKISLITKSGLILRDRELLVELSRRHQLKLLFSCISMDPRLIRAIERRAPTAQLRFRAMKTLSDASIRCELLLMPILPGISDSEENLSAVIAAAKAAGARRVHARVLWLSDSSKKRYLPWLEQNFPELHHRYRDVFQGRRMYTDGAYREVIASRVQEMLEKQGFSSP